MRCVKKLWWLFSLRETFSKYKIPMILLILMINGHAADTFKDVSLKHVVVPYVSVKSCPYLINFSLDMSQKLYGAKINKLVGPLRMLRWEGLHSKNHWYKKNHLSSYRKKPHFYRLLHYTFFQHCFHSMFIAVLQIMNSTQHVPIIDTRHY